MAKFKTIRQREADIDARLEGMGICSLDFGGDTVVQQPDPLVGQSALANSQISKDTLDWYKQKDAETAPYRDKAYQLALEQADLQNATSKKQLEMADDTYDYTKNTFRPIEQKIAADSLGWDTAARRDSESSQAMADVGTSIDAQRANAAREIESRGGDVNSGNYLAAIARGTVMAGAQQGAAGNQARKNVEAIGSAKMADAAAMGRGIAATNATQTQLGIQAGNSSLAAAQTPGNIAAQSGTLMAQGANTAIQGNSSAGNLMLGQYQATTNAQQAASSSSNAMWSGLGQLGGAAIMKYSDKNMKEDIEPVDPDDALAAVEKTPVSTWRYKPESVAADGGQAHTGAMAQDLERNMGGNVAPGGKTVDIISLTGTLMASVKGLAKKVDQLAAASGVNV